MAESPPTFSESWYRVARQRLSLHPAVRVRRTIFRGERWYVLEDALSNQFFRLRPAAYAFVARLSPDRTVEAVWQECVQRFPDEAPGQGAVIQLLSQLYHANLLQYDFAGDSAQLFERYQKRRQREVRARFLNIMFMRFPLLDPDSFLVRTLPLVRWLISPFGALLWLVVVGWALKLVADNFAALWVEGQAVLAPANLPLLYAGLVLVKALHEFGHAYFCRRFGGEVHVMGIMLLIFTPIPYMDASSSWGFRSRWQRCLVGAAGMIVELFVAALATFTWARTGPGLVHSLAYNMMFVASVSTLIFNLNPLLRFDGYYILTDLLGMPNLMQKGGRQLRYLGERYLFGLRQTQAERPAQTGREAAWLTAYGIGSGIYRVIVFGGILLVIADRFLLLGILMAAVCALAWVLVPLGKFVQYLASSPRLERHRPRAVGVTLAVLAAILLLLGVVPFPHHFRAPGVLQARERTAVVNRTPGRVERIQARPAQRVVKGQILVQLGNRELELELVATQARLDEVEGRLLIAATERIADLKPLNELLAATTDRLHKLEADREALAVRARHDGLWVAPGVEDYVGRWLPRGTALGLLVNPADFDFSATVLQADGDALFARPISGAEVRFAGQAGVVVPVRKFSVIPGAQRALPSPALGWHGGGDVPVALDDPQGRQAAEPFFEVRAELSPLAQVPFLHGRAGRIRFDLEPQPLLQRWVRRFMQLLQKRYGV